MVPRIQIPLLEEKISNIKEINNVLLVEGARQVGKTTLIEMALKAHHHVPINLEESRSFSEKIDRCQDFSDLTRLFEAETSLFQRPKTILFIDEAQESQNLGNYVRFMKEKWKDILVILSGSSIKRIFRNTTRYPVGRVTTLHIQPFSFTEFLRASPQKSWESDLAKVNLHSKPSEFWHSQLINLFDQYLEVGGLPEVVITYFQKGPWKNLRENLLLGYYNDFKRVYGEELQSYFIACLKASALLLASPFKNSFVSKILDGGKNKTIIEVLSQLQAWKILCLAEQKGTQPEKYFFPKRYLFDSGIAKLLREQASPHLRLLMTKKQDRTPLGGLIENYVSQSLIGTGLSHELSGWKKDNSGTEIDFIIKHNDQVLPIECKAALSIKNTHLGGVMDFMNFYDVPLAVVPSLAPLELRVIKPNRTVLILPLYLMDELPRLLTNSS